MTTPRVSEGVSKAKPEVREQPRSLLIAGRRHRRQWRDALLRRMLALADAGAALLVSVSLATFLGGGIELGLWAAVFVPVWILLAKLFGLYDLDQRALRNLTVDELPTLLMWALTGTAVMSLVMLAVPGDYFTISTARVHRRNCGSTSCASVPRGRVTSTGSSSPRSRSTRPRSPSWSPSAVAS